MLVLSQQVVHGRRCRCRCSSEALGSAGAAEPFALPGAVVFAVDATELAAVHGSSYFCSAVVWCNTQGAASGSSAVDGLSQWQ
jgi:hypothetical protein